MATTRELVRQRDETMARADAAHAADWPARSSAEFLRVTEWAAGELRRIADSMASGKANALERARTLRHLAGLYWDLAPARGPEQLLEAEGIYREAEHLLQGTHDEEEFAKLDYNLANTLRQIDPNDADRLNEARVRAHRARAYFAAHNPAHLGQCDTMLLSIEQLLRLAPEMKDVQEREKSVGNLLEELKGGGDPNTIARRFKDLVQTGGGMAGTVAKTRSVVETLPPELRTDPRYQAVLEKLAQVGDKVLVGGPASAQNAEIREALQKRLQRESAGVAISPAHRGAIDDAVRQINKMLGNKDESIESLIEETATLRDFAANWIENAHYLSHGIDRPPQGSRAAGLVEMNWLLRRYLMEFVNQPEKGDEENSEALELSIRASTVDKRIYESGKDDAVANVVEVESLRPLAVAVRQFSAHANVMLACPVWGGTPLPVDTKLLFYAGALGNEAILAAALRRTGLHLPDRAGGDAYALLRWKQLQQALVAVFDLRKGTDVDLAGVCYELGIALTLGKPIVVVTAAGERLPFDIDIPPVEVGGTDCEHAVADAVDQATCWTYPDRGGRPWLATVDRALEERGAMTGNVYIDQTSGMLRQERTRNDAVAAHRTLSKLLDYRHETEARLIHPRWLPVYTERERGARLFHVMPFRPKWSAQVADAVREACAGVALYIRGDQVPEADVVRSIWDEIARATHVLVDLTGLNANVSLELGMAHTLGKNVLIVGQGKAADHLFPSVSKQRLHRYHRSELASSLVDSVRAFVAD